MILVRLTNIKINSKFFAFIILILCWNSYPQGKLEKWDKAEINYTLPVKAEKRNYSFEGENVTQVFTRTFINAYWFFISDVDGNNCPFHPSCSAFFVQSVKETNFFRGTLMFADRFTRDINFVNRGKRYPLHVSGRYYDPPYLYELNQKSLSAFTHPKTDSQ